MRSLKTERISLIDENEEIRKKDDQTFSLSVYFILFADRLYPSAEITLLVSNFII